MLEGVFQIVDENGQTAKDVKLPNFAKSWLLELYRVLLTTHHFNQKCSELLRNGRIGFHVDSASADAIAVGTAAALETDDPIFPSHRSVGAALLRGVPLRQLFDSWFGTAEDTAHGRQSPGHISSRAFHVISLSSPIGSQIAQANGAAHAAKLRETGQVVATFLGDGAVASNDFHAGLNFSGVFQCPIVFICDNGSDSNIASHAEGYGIRGARVDGLDVLAVYETVSEAVRIARKGGGATLVDAVTTREVTEPADRLGKWLTAQGHLTSDLDDEMQATLLDEISAAMEEAAGSPQPAMETMFQDVFASPTPALDEQQAAAMGRDTND